MLFVIFTGVAAVLVLGATVLFTFATVLFALARGPFTLGTELFAVGIKPFTFRPELFVLAPGSFVLIAEFFALTAEAFEPSPMPSAWGRGFFDGFAGPGGGDSAARRFSVGNFGRMLTRLVDMAAGELT